jgi:hypothetical protein
MAPSVSEVRVYRRSESNDGGNRPWPSKGESKRYERSDRVTDDKCAFGVSAEVLQAARDRVGMVVGSVTGAGTR